MATIKLRTGTTALWTKANPVLALGEPGYDSESQVLKVGDGSTPWMSLKGYLNETALAAAYASIARQPLNALQFGAVGDGVADDTAALQELLDAAVSTRRASYIPRGRYKITASLTIKVTDATKWGAGVRIYGDGPGFASDGSYSGTVIEPTNAVADAALVVTGVANNDNSNKGQIEPSISDLGIRGVSGGANGDGIRLKYLTNASLRNLKIAFCATAVRIQRQANGATFGYANNLEIDNVHAVANRGWGIDAADAGAICGMTIRASNFGSNAGGGIKIAPAPATLIGNIYTGNAGPALLVVAPTGASQATGPTCTGEHFESNSSSSVSDYSAGSAQVVIESAQCPRFIGCNWLGGTNGENDIMAGHVSDVTGLTLVGGSHTGKTSVASQAVIVAGPNLSRCNVQDTEAFGYGGSSARATSAQMFKSTATDSWTYAHLAKGQVITGAASANSGAATVVVEGGALPLGAHGYFEISSQGGAVYAYGLLRRSHDGLSIVVHQTAASADCSLSIVSNSLRVTQTNTTTLPMFWSLSIVRTL